MNSLEWGKRTPWCRGLWGTRHLEYSPRSPGSPCAGSSHPGSWPWFAPENCSAYSHLQTSLIGWNILNLPFIPILHMHSIQNYEFISNSHLNSINKNREARIKNFSANRSVHNSGLEHLKAQNRLLPVLRIRIRIRFILYFHIRFNKTNPDPTPAS